MAGQKLGARKAFAKCRENSLRGNVAYTVVIVRVVRFAHAGSDTIDAGQRRLEGDVTGAEWLPLVDVLGAEKSDDGQADGGSEMHGPAIVAKKKLETLEQCSEPGDRDLFVNDGDGCNHE